VFSVRKMLPHDGLYAGAKHQCYCAVGGACKSQLFDSIIDADHVNMLDNNSLKDKWKTNAKV